MSYVCAAHNNIYPAILLICTSNLFDTSIM